MHKNASFVLLSAILLIALPTKSFSMPQGFTPTLSIAISFPYTEYKVSGQATAHVEVSGPAGNYNITVIGTGGTVNPSTFTLTAGGSKDVTITLPSNYGTYTYTASIDGTNPAVSDSESINACSPAVTISDPDVASFDSSAAWIADGATVTVKAWAHDNPSGSVDPVNFFVKSDAGTDEQNWTLKGGMSLANGQYSYNWSTSGTSIGRHRIRVKAFCPDCPPNDKAVGKDEMIVVCCTSAASRVTGYCNCYICCGKNPGDPGYGVCADGCTAASGTIAAPSTYAFHTVIYIPGYNGDNLSKVHDRGGAIQGNRLDAWFSTHQAALNWGVKDLTVLVGAVEN